MSRGTSFVTTVIDLLRATTVPPTTIRGATLVRVLKPSRRAHQLHWLQLIAAQLSAFAGLILVLSAFDVTQWLPRPFGFVQVFVEFGDVNRYLPMEWQWLGFTLTIGAFLMQFSITIASLWAEWRTTWYVVTDQGVQQRTGFWTIHETSLRYSNVQQVVLKQGPVQRLLGLGDVVLSTAGQRINSEDEDDKRKPHGHIRDLEIHQAQTLVDLIRQQLPTAVAASRPPLSAAVTTAVPPATLAAGQALRAEALLLRERFERSLRLDRISKPTIEAEFTESDPRTSTEES